jgi:broad specificity phosphatase PhoE
MQPLFLFYLCTGMRPRPQRIILVRHGQSEGNIDEGAYTRIPDSKIALTDVGWKQAVLCGKKIRKIIENDDVDDWQVYFYVSPYRRTLQTLRGIGMAFEQERIAGVREEPRLREQDFGGLVFLALILLLLHVFFSVMFLLSYQAVASYYFSWFMECAGNFQNRERMQLQKAARIRYGRFFYRFPNGESVADVYDRITGKFRFLHWLSGYALEPILHGCLHRA